MKPKLEVGQIWVDEDGDHSIILEVDEKEQDVKILVMSGRKSGEVFYAEGMDNFGHANPRVSNPYFLTCL
jgi:hypothetical protein